MNVDERELISSLNAQRERLLRDQPERVVPCSNGRVATIPASPTRCWGLEGPGNGCDRRTGEGGAIAFRAQRSCGRFRRRDCSPSKAIAPRIAVALLRLGDSDDEA